MKTLKFIAALFVAGILTAGTSAMAEEFKKEFYEAWPASEVASLQIDNRFGEVRVNNNADSVTIDVDITVEGTNEKRLNELLDQIEIEFRKSGDLVKAQTVIEGKLKGQNNLSIDYVVNIPADKNLKITNRYGNTIVSKLTGNGDFTTRYGNFTAYELSTPESGDLELELAYGNANIGSATFLNANISYSPISIEEVKTLTINSKYSTITIEEGGDVNATSRYDKINCEEIKSFNADTRYTHIRIDELARYFKVEAGYGSIKIGEIADDFEEVYITNSYGQISLGLDDSEYTIDASCTYCGISYPEDNFSGDRIKENNSRTIKGKIGSGNGGMVYVRSRYGEIKLK